MCHDEDLAQKRLIAQTRSGYEMEKTYRKIDGLLARADALHQAAEMMRKDLEDIKGLLNIR
jgi:hypothetical protein